MYHNRDELLLFSRTGRLPRGSRAGPYDEQALLAAVAAHGTGRRPSGRAAARRAAVRTCGLASALVRRAPRPGRERPRPAARHAPVDRDAYLELEFAVGFGADDEPGL